jgi:hypothetical protein
MDKSNSKESKDESSSDKANNPKKDLEKMVSLYLASNPIMKTDRKTSELEVRFGTNPRLSRPITKIDYENVVKQLYSSGFTCDNATGLQILRIQNEYIDQKTGITKCSNIRAEIVGVNLVQEYCRTNSIQKILDMTSSISASQYKVKFTQKTPPVSTEGTKQRAVDFSDFNFRVSYQMEQDYTPNSNIAKTIIAKWSDSKKCFRYINRVRFRHPTYPLFADVSIIKGNKKTGKVPIPQYTIQDAGVFENIESYEIELEVDNGRVGTGTEYNTPAKVVDVIRKGVRFVLSGLQGTNYPISYNERDSILQSYMRVMHGDDYQPRKVVSSDFIGPSSYTLQLENIIEGNEGSLVPNIRNNYTVTDKADGDRKLLFISENGRIYMIDTNMNVIFTGAMTNEKTLHNSILDGEHIKFDKTGKYINLYAAFDIYYVNGKSVREFAFMKIEGEEEELDNKYRLLLLIKSMKLIKPYSIMDSGMKKSDDSSPGNISENTHSCDFNIKNKEFYSNSEEMSIFQGCSKILSDIKDDIYQYNTDGLIFTPCNTGVGSSRVGVAGRLSKTTWDMSFKWKPSEFNTIDFLVSVRKDKDGKDEVHNIFQDGLNTTGVQNVVQYKTIILRCGFSEKDHGFLNPMQNIIDDKIPSPDNIDNENEYKPVPFQPTNPYDPKACFCNILLQESGDGTLMMKTKEGEYFEEDMIVEFAYDSNLESGWKWVPLRVRYDKTAELRAGRRNYGNAYHVANNNWHSIHNPITEEMISTGLGLPEYTEDEDVYYNRYNKESSTKGLRNFHNLYVKKKLIVGVSERKNTLIDFAVGKAGDLSKWREGKLGFVFGIDVSKDNINNNLDGACSRYLKDRKKYNVMPSALFAVGNSSLNIRSGQAFATEKDKLIMRAVFGNGPKDRKMLGEGVYKHYGIAQSGFNVSSCQFALHYFFENPSTFHSFIRNIAECTCMGGYFIGTCYDGKTVFNILKSKQEGESIVIMKGDKKIYEVTKMYNQTGFPDDEASLGYPINVYQETINKVFREYLVNFDYFIQIMEDYGFVLISKEEARKMDLPSGTGLFSELFTHMQNEVRRNARKEDDYGDSLKMSDEERRISFMNRYFIFKKIRTVAAEKMAKVISEYSEAEDEAEGEYEDHHDALKLSRKVLGKDEEKEEEVQKQKKITVKKIKNTKLVLNSFSPIIESPVEGEPVSSAPSLSVETTPVAKVSDQAIIFKKPANTSRKSGVSVKAPENSEGAIKPKPKPKIKIVEKF